MAAAASGVISVPGVLPPAPAGLRPCDIGGFFRWNVRDAVTKLEISDGLGLKKWEPKERAKPLPEPYSTGSFVIVPVITAWGHNLCTYTEAMPTTYGDLFTIIHDRMGAKVRAQDKDIVAFLLRKTVASPEILEKLLDALKGNRLKYYHVLGEFTQLEAVRVVSEVNGIVTIKLDLGRAPAKDTDLASVL
jgi:hypothetical protein